MPKGVYPRTKEHRESCRKAGKLGARAKWGNHVPVTIGDGCRRDWYKINSERAKQRYGISLKTIKSYGLRTALAVYDRAGRKCEKCGEENDLTVHHKDNKGRNLENKHLRHLRNNDINNLEILCRRCHGSIHGKQGKGIKKGEGHG